MYKLTVYLSLVFTAFLLFSCAQQVAPSGGPDDTTPPNLMESSPALGATSVERDATIRFFFSEWVNPASAKRSATIYPPIEDGLRVDVSGRTITIKPKDQLQDSTTYHVTLTTALQDLRGNQLNSSIDLYFSTGPQLDSGMVYGCIPDVPSLSQKPTVALYRKDTLALDSQLFITPTYVTQPDTLGAYAFNHIRAGSYVLLAFVDRDNNSRLSSRADEAVFAPLKREIIVDTTSGPFILFPSRADTSAITIQSLEGHSAEVLRVQWSEEPFSRVPPLDTIWQIIPLDTAKVSPPSLDSIVPLKNGMSMYITLDSPMDTSSYRLIYPAYSRTDTLSWFADTIRFNGTTLPDTIAPTLTDSQPKGLSSLRPRISVIWSEPVRILASEIELLSMTEDTIAADTILLRADTTQWSDSTVLTIDSALAPGTMFRVSLPREQVIDIAGNHPIDTADTASPATVDFSFSTLPIDSICLMLKGGAPCLDGDVDRVWIFRHLSRQSQFLSSDSSGIFRFDSIPAGKGTLAYFIDLNNNGMHTEGRLFPWLAPEPYFSFSDTVEARALWEIEGIRVDACRVCPPPGGMELRRDDPESREQGSNAVQEDDLEADSEK
ncbi:MAG: Ig-like domain-containing protein [Fibrobacterota bacterium]